MEKLQSASADQARSTRDILHLIQSQVSPSLPTLPVSSGTACARNTETSVNGLRQFQVRPQLFEAIMMQSSSAASNAENESVSALSKQSPAGW